MINPSEPFRFDDRSGHYGAGQADLAPVSPVAAAPRPDPVDRPVDPMGASPEEGATETPASAPEGDKPSDNPSQVQADTTDTAQTSGTAAPSEAAAIGLAADTGSEATALPPAPEGQPAQMTTMTLSSDAGANFEFSSASNDPTPQGSGAPVALLAPASIAAPADAPTGFAVTAMQMDQMMAEMSARLGSLPSWDRDDDDDKSEAATPIPALADTQDRLDALFEGLRGDQADPASRDPFAEAQARIDDLLDGVDTDDVAGPPLTGGIATVAFDDARDRLDELLERGDSDAAILTAADTTTPLDAARDRLEALTHDSETDSPGPAPAPASLLAQLFDGDRAASFADLGRSDLAERFGDPGDFVFDPPGTAFAPVGWDELPDFG